MTEEHYDIREHLDARIGRAVLALVAAVAVSVVGAVLFNSYLKSGNRTDDMQTALRDVQKDISSKDAEICALEKELASIDIRITKQRERLDTIAERISEHYAEIAKNTPFTVERWDAERRIIDTERQAILDQLIRDNSGIQRQLDAINRRLEVYRTGK